MPALIPEIFRHRDFTLYLSGVAFTQIGTNGAFAAMLYHVYTLTGSTVQVGLVGASRGLAIVVLSPLGGHFADRIDRKTLLQASQAFAMGVSFLLAVVSFTGIVSPSHILLAALATSAAATFDSAARKAIIPAMVPREQLVQAVALVNPTNQVGKLVGPGMAGLLIAFGGPELVYLLDALTYVALIAILGFLRIPPLAASSRALRLWSSIGEGVRYVRDRPVIYQLMGLDLSATLFAAYRVVLPALAVDILRVGPTGYGLLSAAVPAGALLGGVVVFRLASTGVRAGHAVLASTAAFGLAAILLAQTQDFAVALMAAAGLGLFDAIGTTIRHAAVLLETHDALRGRVSALYGMASRGGPPLGDLNIGWLSGLLGVSLALTLGGLVPIVIAAAVAVSSETVREYRASEPRAEEPSGTAPVP